MAKTEKKSKLKHWF